MRPRIFLYGALLLAICSSGCNHRANNITSNEGQDQSFEQYSQRFIDSLWQQYPSWATRVGYHAYDSVLIIPSEENHRSNRVFIEAQLDSLRAYPLSLLSPANQIDHRLIQNRLQSMRWSIDTLQSHEWDPSGYNEAGTFAQILNGKYAPLEDRLRSFAARLKTVPAYYEEAQKRVKNPVPELKELAIKQLKGGTSILGNDFADSLAKAAIPSSEKGYMLQHSKEAVQAIEHFASWLSGLEPDAPRSFRLGKDLYDQKFAFNVQSELSAVELYRTATARKEYLHAEMTKISKALWPNYYPDRAMPSDSLQLIKQMIDRLSVHHASADGFLDTIRQILPRLTDFINAKELLYIDPSKPLTVRETPAYMGGVAVASISAPGPYDKEGMTYYNVIPLKGWPRDKTESFLREYNQYIVQILTIHEAIPGHYTQLVYANQSPSLIKSLFGNGAMIEGWAVYTEQMMLENGFGKDSPEMWLMWYKWHLRAVANAILDYEVHVNGMDKGQAMDFLIHAAFQEKTEAEGKWDRVRLSSVQLTSYFAGYHEIYQLREKLKKKEGSKFDLKQFHESFLSYGNAPVKYISTLMLE